MFPHQLTAVAAGVAPVAAGSEAGEQQKDLFVGTQLVSDSLTMCSSHASCWGASCVAGATRSFLGV